jgi:hypothetical protein
MLLRYVNTLYVPARASFQSYAIVKERINSSMRTGGGERVRTDDLLLARQALSQLSYTP